MSTKSRKTASCTMLELWRPPQDAGDPVGCLTSTYTFDPGMFDEQCLARFLDIDSEPNREDLAFLLERERRLGGIYAGVLVDHGQAGVSHSLRWDVLPVRVNGARQHAKLSVLAWTRMVRVIIASANLTTSGYRLNQEVAVPVDASLGSGNADLVVDACGFLRAVLRFVRGGTPESPELQRAARFLDQVQRQVQGWAVARRGGRLRQRLVCTLPSLDGAAAGDERIEARSTLDEAIDECRRRGGSPRETWVASPFFDVDGSVNEATASLHRQMARGQEHHLWFCVPSVGEFEAKAPRLAAPRSLLETAKRAGAAASIEVLPSLDEDENPRPWHAKMYVFRAAAYSALMVGSSNFTRAGLGTSKQRNIEANLITIAEPAPYGREIKLLEAVWPETQAIGVPDRCEWLGPDMDLNEEEQAPEAVLPAGFLSAIYRAGGESCLILRLAADRLPEEWSVHACGQAAVDLLQASQWVERGRPEDVVLPWRAPQPPEKLRVCWDGGDAFWPFNVEDARRLPPPSALEQMAADDMLLILAASDPSAAFRAWTRRQRLPGAEDEDLDAAMPIDLDPLRRHDAQATFLHRVRRRARVLADLRANLERPVWSSQALEWRLRGLIGVEALATRILRELTAADSGSNEAMLALADFLIVLREVRYGGNDEQSAGALSCEEFARIYRPFLRELAANLDVGVQSVRQRGSPDLGAFWDRVVQRCQR